MVAQAMPHLKEKRHHSTCKRADLVSRVRKCLSFTDLDRAFESWRMEFAQPSNDMVVCRFRVVVFLVLSRLRGQRGQGGGDE
jgi:hypothetical protein